MVERGADIAAPQEPLEWHANPGAVSVSQAETPTTYYINMIIPVALFAIALTLVNLALTERMMRTRGAFVAPPEIVTINAGDMLLGFVARSAPDIGEDELRRRARALNQDLEAAVRQIASENNWIVVNSGSVLAGTRDITALILDHMSTSAAFAGTP